MPVFRKKGKPAKKTPAMVRAANIPRLSGRVRRRAIKSVIKKRQSKDFLSETSSLFGNLLAELGERAKRFFVLKDGMLLKSGREVKAAKQKFKRGLTSFILKKVNSLPPHERAQFLLSTHLFLSNLEVNLVLISPKPKPGHENLKGFEDRAADIVGDILKDSIQASAEKCVSLFAELPKSARHSYHIGPYAPNALLSAFAEPLLSSNILMLETLKQAKRPGSHGVYFDKNELNRGKTAIAKLFVRRFEKLYNRVP